MDVFGKKWERHEEKIFDAWKRLVSEEDRVLVVGDISWALKLEEGEIDLKRLDALPGKKYLIKGNHDYWWSSLNKLNSLDLRTIEFLHNTGAVDGHVAYCGSRGWTDIDATSFDEQDEKIYKRELNRLQLSIDDMEKKAKDQMVEKRIALLHYPPFNAKGEPNDFAKLLEKGGIDICIYGHLHSYGHQFVVEGNLGSVDYFCVSSDYIDFEPRKIEV